MNILDIYLHFLWLSSNAVFISMSVDTLSEASFKKQIALVNFRLSFL